MNTTNGYREALYHPARISQLDIARGVAVVLMIMGHTIDAVLAPGPRLTEAFRYYDALRGFTAPLFLLLAGFAFSVATVKRWEEHARFGRLTARRFLRAALLLAVGYALHLPFFSFGKLLFNASPEDYALFLQADVLHCVALSLAALQLSVLLARTPARHQQVTLVLGLAIAAVAPVVWAQDFSGILPRVIIPYLNQQYRSMFPLVPYAAYMFIGAALGHSYLRARQGGKERLWSRRAMILAGLLAGLGLASELLPWSVYGVHDYWKTNPGILAIRAGLVVTILAAFLHLRQFPGALARMTTVLGQSSLVVYVAHLVLVYGSVANPGLGNLLGQDLSVAAAITLGLGVVALMTGLAFAFRALRSDYRKVLRIAQASTATLLLYLFISRPY